MSDDELIGVLGDNSKERLKSFVDRMIALEEEKANLTEDIKDIRTEAKAAGFHAPTLTKIVRLRRMDKEKFREQQDLLDIYMEACDLI